MYKEKFCSNKKNYNSKKNEMEWLTSRSKNINERKNLFYPTHIVRTRIEF